jgi:glycerol-3-phosphate acyltransferase PlsY
MSAPNSLFLLTTFQHKLNIKKLFRGEENKIKKF